MTAVAVLGAGSWGTALAVLLARNGHQVRLWGRDPVQIAALERQRENHRYLPGLELPQNLQPCVSMAQAVRDTGLVVVAVPSAGFGQCIVDLRALVLPDTGLVCATKGFDPVTGGLLHETAAAQFDGQLPLAALSGPSFAREVAQGLPTAVTLASHCLEVARRCAAYFHAPNFRVYTTDDLVGVEVAGAVKNVLAIAAGIVDGLHFGANARAALVTRGLAELLRLGVALGGRPETFMGLAGLGDLMLTCSDDQSRNRRFGLALASGLDRHHAAEQIGQVVEGAQACALVDAMAKRYAIEMPICAQVYDVLFNDVSPLNSVRQLLAREPRSEVG